MKCEQGDMMLLLYAHGELPWLQTIRLRAHLRRCADCRQSVDRWTFVSRSIRSHMSTLKPSTGALGFAGRIPTFRLMQVVALVLVIAGAAAYGFGWLGRSSESRCETQIAPSPPAPAVDRANSVLR